MIFDVNEKGKPYNIRVTSDTTNDSSWVSVAVNAVKRWRYTPATENGKRVPAYDLSGWYDFTCGPSDVARERAYQQEADYVQRVGAYLMACKDASPVACMGEAMLQAKGLPLPPQPPQVQFYIPTSMPHAITGMNTIFIKLDDGSTWEAYADMNTNIGYVVTTLSVMQPGQLITVSTVNATYGLALLNDITLGRSILALFVANN